MQNQTYLSKDQIRKMAPSAFAENPYHTTSDKYVFVPTIEVVNAMESIGFYPVSARQSRVTKKNVKKEGYQKHVITFETKGDNIIRVGDSSVRIMLTNSSDGLQSFMLDAQVHRKVCDNGLIVGDSMIESVQCRHMGENVIKDITDGTQRIIEQVPLISDVVSDWSKMQLNKDEQSLYAKAALQLKYENLDESPIQSIDLARPRRYGDEGNDLWTAFNKAQDWMINGGVKGYNEKTRKRVTTKPVTSIDANRKINKALFEITSFFADRKNAV